MEIKFYNRKTRGSKKFSFARIDGKRTSVKKASEELSKHPGRMPVTIQDSTFYTILWYNV